MITWSPILSLFGVRDVSRVRGDQRRRAGCRTRSRSWTSCRPTGRRRSAGSARERGSASTEPSGPPLAGVRRCRAGTRLRAAQPEEPGSRNRISAASNSAQPGDEDRRQRDARHSALPQRRVRLEPGRPLPRWCDLPFSVDTALAGVRQASIGLRGLRSGPVALAVARRGLGFADVPTVLGPGIPLGALLGGLEIVIGRSARGAPWFARPARTGSRLGAGAPCRSGEPVSHAACQATFSGVEPRVVRIEVGVVGPALATVHPRWRRGPAPAWIAPRLRVLVDRLLVGEWIVGPEARTGRGSAGSGRSTARGIDREHAARIAARKSERPAGGASRLACAASRRAQSWKIGQTGNAAARQYASWWASARGAGGVSA